MSAVLSNLLLLEFDLQVNDWVTELGGLYRRYCDDIMVVIPLEHEDLISQLVYYEMDQLNQVCNPDKTEIAHFQGGDSTADHTLQYLGCTFDGRAIKLRPSSLDRYYGKMRKGVKNAVKCQRKSIRRSEFIKALRPESLCLSIPIWLRAKGGREKHLTEL